MRQPGARQQAGIALLTAIILVAVAAVIATAIGWQSQLAARRGSAVFTVAQSLALAEGAEAMAAYALTTLPSGGTTVAPSQAWAQPLGPVEIDHGALLEAALEDESGKFNLNSVVQVQGINPLVPGSPAYVLNPTTFQQFQNLLTALKLDPDFAARVVDWIDSNDIATFPGGGEDSFYLTLDPPYRTPNMVLTSVSELLAMGLDRASYDKLAPFVTALPASTKLNTCTAPGEVLDALSGHSEYAVNPERLADTRKHDACFPNPDTVKNGLPAGNRGTPSPGTPSPGALNLGTGSQFFRLRSWITIGTTHFTLYSLLYISGTGQVRPILRTFGTE